MHAFLFDSLVEWKAMATVELTSSREEGRKREIISRFEIAAASAAAPTWHIAAIRTALFLSLLPVNIDLSTVFPLSLGYYSTKKLDHSSSSLGVHSASLKTWQTTQRKWHTTITATNTANNRVSVFSIRPLICSNMQKRTETVWQSKTQYVASNRG